MNVEIGTVGAQFLFWEYLLQIFRIGSMYSTEEKLFLLQGPCLQDHCGALPSLLLSLPGKNFVFTFISGIKRTGDQSSNLCGDLKLTIMTMLCRVCT